MNNIEWKYFIPLAIGILIWWLLPNQQAVITLPGKVTTKVDTVEKEVVKIVDRIVYVDKLKATIDTVYINDSTKVEVARADTVLQKDSVKIEVSYFFPPLNYFEFKADLKEKIIEKFSTITIKEVKVIELPFYQDNWFYGTVIGAILVVVSLL